MSVLADLDPVGVWDRFAELTRIARPPKQEAEVREHVLAWAAGHEFEAAADGEGNVVVRVPASTGRARAPTVVLQAHLDMVCERDPDSPFDPRAGRIHVVLDGDWVVAEGTTLGADNGIGVAAAMAAAEDPGISHGPLELLFTVSEEQGLDGAKALDPSLVAGRLLLNLDGTSDTAITIGCAGSAHTFTRLPLPPEPAPNSYVTLEVVLSGARGGHSGGDIAKGRVNAIKALGRVLGRSPLRLARLDGGVSRNALPREARAAIALAPGEEHSFREAAERKLVTLHEQYAGTDYALDLAIDPVPAEHAADEATSARALDLLATLPSGVVAMNPELPSSVETSTSLNVVTTEDAVLTFASMTRSGSAARGSGGRGPPLVSAVAPGPRREAAGHGADDLRAAVRGGSGPRGRARRARVRGDRWQAPRRRDDLPRPGDRRPARSRRAAQHLGDAALLPSARRAPRRPFDVGATLGSPWATPLRAADEVAEEDCDDLPLLTPSVHELEPNRHRCWMLRASRTLTRPRWRATVPRFSSSRRTRLTVAREAPAMAARSSWVRGTTGSPSLSPYVSASSQSRLRTRVSESTWCASTIRSLVRRTCSASKRRSTSFTPGWLFWSRAKSSR
jgi:dipeptidase D